MAIILHRLTMDSLWSGQYMMTMGETWHYIQELPVDWVRLSELCLLVSEYGRIHKPLLVRLDEAPPRLAQGHHRYWVACMLGIDELPVTQPAWHITSDCETP